MHIFLISILLGLGAAVPVGPINLEMIRRNLQHDTKQGVVFGLGACSADLTYLILLCIGMLAILNEPHVLRATGIIGAIILSWFGYKAFTTKTHDQQQLKKVRRSLLGNGLQGYLLTLINPMTILFWGSITTQVSMLSKVNNSSLILASLGVLTGTLLWVGFINTTLHFTRHKISELWLGRINKLGGVILIGFAISGFVHSFLL